MSALIVFDFRRHFLLLAVAIALLAGFSRFPLYDDALFASTLNGSLHAVTLIASLRIAATASRKLLFVGIAAALSVLTLYVGIIALGMLSTLPSSQRLPLVIGISALTGAITYGSLVRIFWIRPIRPRAILGLATVCAAATVGGYFLKLQFDWNGMWWLAAIWWLTFSLCLRSLRAPPARQSVQA